MPKSPVVLCYDGGVSNEPDAYAVNSSAAVLFLTYDCTPDHGSSMGNFYHKTLPSVLADMLYGVKTPSGKTVFEMAWTSEDAELDWGELQFDTGVDTKTRLYMAAVARNNPTADLPTNLGDVMYPAHFGMRYDQPADITCNTLIAPQGVREVSEETSSGTRMATKVLNLAKAGETFEINFIAENNGADGYINVEVLVDGELAATKMIAVSAGSFRVVTIPLTLDAGEHVITVGGMTANLTVE